MSRALTARTLARSALRRAGALEARLAGPTEPRWPMLFIVGPPRSGTTLIYQAICHGLQVAYPTNLMVEGGLTAAPRLYRGVAALLGSRMAAPSDFASDHGRTHGPGSPHEAGALWSPWFTEAHTLRPGADGALRTAIAGIQAAFGAPFVNKNVMHVPRLAALAEALPTALFLEVRRDVLATARSIFRARSRPGVPGGWWSVRPSNIADLLDLSLPAQAVGQVLGVQADLAAARDRLGPARWLTLTYEAFCADPTAALRPVAEALGAGTRAALPLHFSVEDRPLEPVDEAALRAALATAETPSPSPGGRGAGRDQSRDS